MFLQVVCLCGLRLRRQRENGKAIFHVFADCNDCKPVPKHLVVSFVFGSLKACFWIFLIFGPDFIVLIW